MKGAAAGKPGQVLLVDYPEPNANDEDIVLDVLACGVCSTDIKAVQKGALDTRYALGHEVVGIVSKTARSLPWGIGQRVAVVPYLPCDACYFCKRGQPALCTNLYDVSIMPGGMAERVLIPADLARRGMFALPESMRDFQAALAEPLGCVIKGLEDAYFHKGDALVVIGDGPMGQLAAAAGKALGADLVIMAGLTNHRLDYAKDLFADVIVNTAEEDIHEVVAGNTNQRGADVVLVSVSNGDTLAVGIDLVRAGGWVNAFAGVPEGTRIELDVRKLHYKQYHLTGSSGLSPQNMKRALELLQSSSVDFSKIVTASFPFIRVAQAVDYMANRVGLKAVVTFT